ncbi:MAG: 30S ribosomal protein S20 [Candidatus Gracilibacteria bacterium]|jgi:small subunit ribosomal protein S20|nr:30S ribosomal protein S20 [Candidatus Gracilibacteria bacterium]MDD5179174.1 30S ribosomal protein S20 [Candidatus Gracilibacteria bacterium]
MPLIKSAIKKMRKDKKNTARNRMQKEKMQDSIQAVKAAAGKKDSNMSEVLKSAYKAIDKAVKRNLLHPKTGSRRKAKVAKIAKKAAGK